MPEAITIMKLAKEEARRIGRNTVGTEMFLLGIIAEGNGIGHRVLNELEVSIKDARKTVEEKAASVIFGYYVKEPQAYGVVACLSAGRRYKHPRCYTLSAPVVHRP